MAESFTPATKSKWRTNKVGVYAQNIALMRVDVHLINFTTRNKRGVLL